MSLKGVDHVRVGRQWYFSHLLIYVGQLETKRKCMHDCVSATRQRQCLLFKLGGGGGGKALTLSSICSISIDNESKTCSPSSGAVSTDVVGTGELPTLLYATSLMSISFSNLRACLRKTKNKTKTQSISHTMKIDRIRYLVSIYRPNRMCPSLSDILIYAQ